MTSTWKEPKDWQKRPVVVLGGGVLGRRVAACWAAGGWPVIIRDPSADQRKAALAYLEAEIGTYTAITERDSGSFNATEDLPSAVKEAWLVIEAVPERLDIKLATFADLEKYSPSDCIFASNSSSYKSRELVEKVSDETKKRCLNTHYMMPPESLVVELMTDGVTEQALFPWLAERHKQAGLHPVVALKESTGFIFNRIWAAIKRETLSVLAEGVSGPEAIDQVFREIYGARAGPCQMMDQVGLDTVEFIEEHYIKERQLSRSHLDYLHEQYIKPGKLGQKSDKGGFYAPPKQGSAIRLFFLNVGLGEPLREHMSFAQVLHRGQVLAMTLGKDSKPQELVASEATPDGIVICHAEQRMYWTNMGNPPDNDGSIHSAKLDGTDIKTIVEPGKVHTPKQCTLDEDAKKLYFCDREGLRVFRVNLDGSELETLIQNGDFKTEREKVADQTNWPVGIAISPKMKKIFWTQKGFSKAGKGRIFSAGIDLPKGASPSKRDDIEIVMSGLPEPIDLELDEEENVLYWTDRGELPLGNTLNKKHLSGPAPEAEGDFGCQILAQGFGEAIGLKLDKENRTIYVADMSGRVWKCDADKPSLKQKIWEGPTSSFTGLAFIKT